MRLIGTAWTLVGLLAFGGMLRAADEPKPAPAKRPQYGPVFFPGLEQLTLTDDQRAKVAALRSEYAPKLAEIGKKMEAVYTDEQKTALHAAAQAAKAASKSPKATHAAIRAALKLTDDQKSKLRDVFKEMQPLEREFRDKVMHSLNLTSEQQRQLEALNPRNAFRTGGQKPQPSGDDK